MSEYDEEAMISRIDQMLLGMHVATELRKISDGGRILLIFILIFIPTLTLTLDPNPHPRP